jgi:hypothetical protein
VPYVIGAVALMTLRCGLGCATLRASGVGLGIDGWD